MLRQYVTAKIQRIAVTDKSLNYNGSVSICPELMKAAGIREYERVDVVNLANGERWSTYAIPAAVGAFTLNGGGARLGEVGDRCVIMTYGMQDHWEPYAGADVVYCNPDNTIERKFRYATGEAVP